MTTTKVAKLLAAIQILESTINKQNLTIKNLEDQVVELLGNFHLLRQAKAKMGKELSRQRIKNEKLKEQLKRMRHLYE